MLYLIFYNTIAYMKQRKKSGMNMTYTKLLSYITRYYATNIIANIIAKSGDIFYIKYK